jgi:hypothetical protein
VETRVGRAVLEAFVDIRPELRLPQLLDIEHGDVRHGGDYTDRCGLTAKPVLGLSKETPSIGDG